MYLVYRNGNASLGAGYFLCGDAEEVLSGACGGTLKIEEAYAFPFKWQAKAAIINFVTKNRDARVEDLHVLQTTGRDRG